MSRPEPLETPIILSDRRIQTFCLLVLTTIGIAFAMFYLRPVLVPFTLALFAAIVLTPLVNYLTRHLRLPKAIALLVAMLLCLAVFVILGGIITSSIAGLESRSDSYRDRFVAIYDNLEGTALRVEGLMQRLGLGKEHFNISDMIQKFLENLAGYIQSSLLTATGAFLSLVSSGILVLIFVFFLMLGGMASEEKRTGFWAQVEDRVKRYLLTKLFVSALTGVLVAFSLAILGIDLAIAFGFLAFTLNFIPNIGSLISTLLPLPIILLEPDITPLVAILAIAIPGAIQLTIGNIVEPKLMGDSLDLHPVAILMALIFFGMIWGIVGMLLATPIAAVIKIILSRFDMTQPFAEIMAGRMKRRVEEPAV